MDGMMGIPVNTGGVQNMPWGLFALGAGMFVGYLIKKKSTREYEFDERQKADRGNAFRLAWFVLAVYETVYAFLAAMGIRFADEAAGPCLGVLLSFAVFCFASASRDAFLPFRDRGNAPLNWVLWITIGFIWLGLFGFRACRRGVFSHGIITAGMLEFFAALLMIAFGTVQLIRLLRRRGKNCRGESE